MPNDFDERTVASPVVGDVLALRSFQVDPITRTLGGLTYNQEIAPGVNLAQCGLAEDGSGHPAPHPGCRCGWYAYDERRHWVGGSGLAEVVSAVVRLSGKIIVCERGLKAEGMEVLAVASASTYAHLVRAVLPDVELFASEDEMLKQYPLQRLSRDEEEDEVGGFKDVTLLGLTLPTAAVARAATQIGGRVSAAWTSLSAHRDLWSSVRWIITRFIIFAVYAVALWSVMTLSREVFPPGSLGGFGTLAPFGVLIVLSPILNLWRSVWGLFTYLALLTYGVLGSEQAIATLIEGSPLTNMQANFIGTFVYMVPICLLCGHLVRPLVRRPAPGAGTGVVIGTARGASGPSLVVMGAGTGKTAAMAGGYQRKHLPKKVKSDPPRDGEATPDATEEGGQHG